jgi:hypothetical protein
LRPESVGKVSVGFTQVEAWQGSDCAKCLIM